MAWEVLGCWALGFQALDQMYGSMGRSMMTLFRSIIGGVDIDQAAHPLARVSVVLPVLYTIYLAFMILGVLNVLTGIFCDAAMQAAQSDRANVIQAQMEDDAALMRELRDIFEATDIDGSGKVCQKEMDKMLQDQEVVVRFATIGVSCTGSCCAKRMIWLN